VFFEPVKADKTSTPKWLEFDNAELKGKVLALPLREDIDLTISEQLIVERYSK
jgi:small subunit ribosomal protein S4